VHDHFKREVSSRRPGHPTRRTRPLPWSPTPARAAWRRHRARGSRRRRRGARRRTRRCRPAPPRRFRSCPTCAAPQLKVRRGQGAARKRQQEGGLCASTCAQHRDTVRGPRTSSAAVARAQAPRCLAATAAAAYQTWAWPGAWGRSLSAAAAAAGHRRSGGAACCCTVPASASVCCPATPTQCTPQPQRATPLFSPSAALLPHTPVLNSPLEPTHTVLASSLWRHPPRP
jgi:hypothetical protein